MDLHKVVQVEDSSAAVSNDATTLCMVCEDSKKQYKCPRCDYFTCSLKCCKQHKIDVSMYTLTLLRHG